MLLLSIAKAAVAEVAVDPKAEVDKAAEATKAAQETVSSISIGDWLQPAVIIGTTVIGLLLHYVRSESNNKWRYHLLEKRLDSHENRIQLLENKQYRADGNLTYITRSEYEKDDQTLRHRCADRREWMKEIQKCMNEIKAKTRVLEEQEAMHHNSKEKK